MISLRWPRSRNVCLPFNITMSKSPSLSTGLSPVGISQPSWRGSATTPWPMSRNPPHEYVTVITNRSTKFTSKLTFRRPFLRLSPCGIYREQLGAIAGVACPMYDGDSMECHCIRLTELPQTTRLFATFLDDFSRVAEFYSHPPTMEGIVHAAEEVKSDPRYEPGARTVIVE